MCCSKVLIYSLSDSKLIFKDQDLNVTSSMRDIYTYFINIKESNWE